MADLTANRITPNVVTLDDAQGGYVLSYGIAASEEIFEGMFVEMDAGGDLTSAGTAAITKQCLGVALERKTGGSSDSDVSALVLVGAIIQHAVTATLADIGAVVYLSDDQTATLTAAATSGVLGRIVAIGDSANVMKIQMLMPRVLQTAVWAVTNLTADYVMDCNSAADLELADVSGTIIRDLISQGILQGATST